MRRERGFTLVELLVIISILSVLLSILAPTLNRSKELVRRAVCASHMKNTIHAALSYAGESREALPISQYLDSAGTEHWTYSFDIRKRWPGPPFQEPLGIGLCVAAGYLPSGELGSSMHCPSLNTTYVESKGGQSPTNWHSMNVDKPNWWAGLGCGWWNSTQAEGNYSRRLIAGYHYRSPSWWRTHGKKHLRSSNAPANSVIYSDVLDPRFGGQYGHKDGYNVTRIDGSGRYVGVTPEQVEAVAMANGSPNTDGYADATSDEKIMELFELYP